MDKLVPIRAAATALGVSTGTLRRWEASGFLVPLRTEGGRRHYDLAALRPGFVHAALAPRQTIACGRVCSHDERADLERQKRMLELYCAHLYGSRSHRNQKLIDGVRQAVLEAQC